MNTGAGECGKRLELTSGEETYTWHLAPSLTEDKTWSSLMSVLRSHEDTGFR
jgi:hypothetical protein